MAKIKLPPAKDIAPGDYKDALESFVRHRLYAGKAARNDWKASIVTPTSITADRHLGLAASFDEAADAWAIRLHRWLEQGNQSS